MRLQKFIEVSGAKVLTSQALAQEIEIFGGYVGDLLSDVMGSAAGDQAWITIMRHLNVVAVASLAGIKVVIFSKGIIPAESVITKADEEKVCLLSSPLSSFELAGRLYELTKVSGS